MYVCKYVLMYVPAPQVHKYMYICLLRSPARRMHHDIDQRVPTCVEKYTCVCGPEGGQPTGARIHSYTHASTCVSTDMLI